MVISHWSLKLIKANDSLSQANFSFIDGITDHFWRNIRSHLPTRENRRLHQSTNGGFDLSICFGLRGSNFGSTH